MKTLGTHVFQIIVCLIIASFSMGQGTINLTDGIKVGISSGTSVSNENLNIEADSRLTNRGELTVTGVLVNFAGTSGLVLKADENGYGSLMHDTPNVNAMVEQYLSSERWHLVTSPVSESTIEPYLDIYLKEWSEEEGSWAYLVQPITMPMNQLQGYSAWASDALTGSTTVVFEGKLNSGNAVYDSLTFTPGGEMEGYNLIGNPYPSPVEWNTNWYLQDVGGWAVIYDNGIFKGWNPWLPEGQQSYNGKTDGMMAPMQGFWIKATGSDPVVVAPQSARKHQLEPFYKKDLNSNVQYITLHSAANGYSDETTILFLPEGTEGFDGLYELNKHWNVDEAPNIYSKGFGDSFLAVNVLPEDWITTSNSPVIPIGFKIGPGSECLISAEGIETFSPDTPVLLEDLKEGTFQNLKEEPGFTFTSSPLDEADRFLLHFAEPTGISEIEGHNIKIYSYENKVYIQIPNSVKGTAKVFDLKGITISSFDLDQALTSKSISGTGYYIVQVIANRDLITQKVFIKN